MSQKLPQTLETTQLTKNYLVKHNVNAGGHSDQIKTRLPCICLQSVHVICAQIKSYDRETTDSVAG